jgi:MOSC domain-containing protein YiiM
VISVNVGRVRDAAWAGRQRRTAIDKRPVDGRVAVGALGLAGDEHAATRSHGGIHQAAYAYAREDYDWWQDQLDMELPAGIFGENLTVSGLDVSGALLGERWRIGTALGVVTGPRIPCATFRGWMDRPGWVRRFTEAGRPGAYLRIQEEGEVASGDAVEIVHRPAAGVTVAESLRAYHGDVGLLRRILEVPDHSPKWDLRAEQLAHAGTAATEPEGNARSAGTARSQGD